MSECVLFVFFQPTSRRAWDYPRIGISAPGWWFVGGGGTASRAYPRENQFQGPLGSRPRALAYLARKFRTLVRAGEVGRFAIFDRYEDPRSLQLLRRALFTQA